jgi:hypothetical protein
MERQEALAHILTLAANHISASADLALSKDYSEVFYDMPSCLKKEYWDWLVENGFIEEI